MTLWQSRPIVIAAVALSLVLVEVDSFGVGLPSKLSLPKTFHSFDDGRESRVGDRLNRSISYIGVRSRLYQSPDKDQQQQLKESQLIESWLNTHLPTLPPADVQSYTTYLYNDGFTSLDKLNSINSGSSGRVEDLPFMKKGHRRVLMKKIGIMRAASANAGNRLVKDGGLDDVDKSSSTSSISDSATKETQGTQKKGEKPELDTSIEDWLTEQNRMVEERRLTRLQEEEQLKKDSKSTMASTFSEEDEGVVSRDVLDEFLATYDQSLNDFANDPGAVEKGGRRLEKMKQEFLAKKRASQNSASTPIEEEEILDDLQARYQALDSAAGESDAWGTKEKEIRRLELMRQEFLDRAKTNRNVVAQEEELLDDLQSRYGSLDLDGMDGAANNKGLRRLEEMKQEFLERAKANRNADQEEEDRLDDLQARYQSLDIEAMAMDSGTKNKELRRLEEMKQEFIKRSQANRNAAQEEEDRLDDLQARYHSLDIEDMGAGTKNKESRRLEEMKQEFMERARANQNAEQMRDEEDQLDDLGARYESLDIESMGEGTKNKESRRLEEMKEAFLQKKRALVLEEEEPLRLDLLKQKQGETAVDQKERMRVEKFQQLASKRNEGSDKKQQFEEDIHQGDFISRGPQNNSNKAQYKTGGERRLEDLERYFNKRRAVRIAEEERLEKLMMEAKVESASKTEEVNPAEDSVPASSGEEALEEEFLDDFFKERRDAGRSMSTTMPPKGKGRDKDQPGLGKGSRDADVDFEEAYSDITKSNIRERKGLSLATTMAPTNRGVEVQPSNKDSSDECLVEDEDCWDITHSAFPRRDTRSLATTLPPSNTRENIMSPPPAAKQKGDKSDIREDAPVYDIARSAFAPRESRSLATTLPPSNTKENMPPPPVIENDVIKSNIQEDEPVFDITQNLFPESRGQRFRSLSTAEPRRRPPPSARAPESAFREGEKSEMNDRRPPNINVAGAAPDDEVFDITRGFPDNERTTYQEQQSEMNSRQPPSPPANAKMSSNEPKLSEDESGAEAKVSSSFNQGKTKDTNSKASELYQRFQAERTTSFDRGDRTEMNNRPAPVHSNLPSWARMPDSIVDSNAATESYLDTTSFPKERPSSLVNTGTKKKGVVATGLYAESKKTTQKPADDTSPYLDISTSFLKDRPSSLVNTGTKKQVSDDDTNSNLIDISSSFPKDRPSSLVNTGTKKKGIVTTGANDGESKKRRSEEDRRHDDSNFVDITQNSFSEDRGSFMLRVNSGTKKPGTTSGTYEESKKRRSGEVKDVAHNFSSDRASLIGLPATKRPPSTPKGNDDYLDKNQFSSDLTPPAPVTAHATSEVWRDSSTKKDEQYLDTPRAFAKRLDMMPSARGGAARKTATNWDKMNADQYLDKNPFSSNLRFASGSGSSSKVSGNEFLDQPRPFKTNMEMRTSNLHGRKFKRSSDIPPEEKNVRDYYDITTASMPDIDGMANTKRRRQVEPLKGDEYFDITRKKMKPLQRTSSVIIDENKATKNKPLGSDDEKSYDEVMYWLLTNLPQLPEEDAISYFNQLLSDGFDSKEMCLELLEEDIAFMKPAHQRKLLRSLQTETETKVAGAYNSLQETEEDDEAMHDEEETKFFDALDDEIEKAKSELEKTETWLREMADEAKIAGEEEAAMTDSNSLVDQGEPFADITHSRFVDRPGMSSVAPNSQITRELFPNRSNSLREKSKVTSTPRLGESKASGNFFDITRDSFQDRQTLSAAVPKDKGKTSGNFIDRTRDSFQDRQTLSAAVPKDREASARDRQTLSAAVPKDKEASARDRQSFSVAVPKDEEASAPHKLTELVQKSAAIAPRAELNKLYIKKGFTQEQTHRIKDYFTTWKNEGKDHEAKFTAIFTDPMTGEHFSCGNWKNGGDVESKDNTFWFKNKKQAMNAAAARALDCFNLRVSQGTDIKPTQLCEDEPYLIKDDVSIPTLPTGVSLPSEVINPVES